VFPWSSHGRCGWPFGVRQRPKLPTDAAGDELARIFRQYSVTVPDFRSPEYTAALTKATLRAPSGDILRRMGSPLTGYETFMAGGPASPAWNDVDLIDASHTGATPSININGWMDVGAYETVKLFEFQQHHREQYLIMAPTEHCRMLVTGPEARLGQRPMGDTRFPYDEIIISWFDRFLCDEADAWQPMPKAQVFLMGAGAWLTGDSWPLPETETRTLFLASGKSASTLWGDGALVPAARGAGTDEFIADPHNPVQSLGGDLSAHDPVCVDQRVIECRADVLVYSTPVLTEPIAIVGDVSAELYVSADVEDADVFVKLVDVYPDGTAYNLADTCLRLRYRDGFQQPPSSSPARSTGSGSLASPPRTTSRLATASASRSPAPTSRTRTATGTPTTATTWPPTARSRTSPSTTDRATSQRCTSAPTPARSRSTRRCPAPGPAADRDGFTTGTGGAPYHPHHRPANPAA
jgi:uncharacterized protein